MKTVYLRKLRSGNFEISNKSNASDIIRTKKDALNLWNKISNEKSKSFDYKSGHFKSAKIIKARYSQATTYYDSFQEFYNHIKTN